MRAHKETFRMGDGELNEADASQKKPLAPQGMYIPPARMQMYLEHMETDKKTEEYQRMAWETMKKSIFGLINKVNIANISFVAQEIFQENLVRGRGILCYCVMRAQVMSPMYTHIFAALLAIINTKFPRNGELMLRRLVIQFRRAFKRNEKNVCINSSKFIAHLVNQNVAHEILALEILTLLLQNPSNDSIEVAVSFLKEVGAKLQIVSPKGSNAVFERLRNILHDADVEFRVQYMIEVIFAIRKNGFKDFPVIVPELDLILEEDQITHLIRLDDNGSTDDILSTTSILRIMCLTCLPLDIFKYDPNYEQNEEKYSAIKREILEDSGDEEEDQDLEKIFDENNKESESEDDAEDSEDNDGQTQADSNNGIIDKTETDNIALRRLVYLVIQSSLDFEECAHKLVKVQLKPNQEYEFCAMIVDCCMQQRSYEKFYGLLTERFCLLKPEFMEKFMDLFKEHYQTCHRLDTVKLRNVSKLFAHLLFHDAILWTVLDVVSINEDDTTSSNRIFLKMLFQELNEFMGIDKLKERLLNEETLLPYFQGMFPKDNPKNTRFAINFFTAIGLGPLTEELRQFLKQVPKNTGPNLTTTLSGPTPLHPLLVEAAKAAQASKYIDKKSSEESSSSDSERRRRDSRSTTRKEYSQRSRRSPSGGNRTGRRRQHRSVSSSPEKIDRRSRSSRKYDR